MKTIFMNWTLNSSFGWGILGLNLFCQWANDSAVRPVMGQPITDEGIFGLDPLRLNCVMKAMFESNKVLQGLVPKSGTTAVDATMIDCLGNGFVPSSVVGNKNIGRCIFEDTRFDGARERLARYDA